MRTKFALAGLLSMATRTGTNAQEQMHERTFQAITWYSLITVNAA